MVDWFARGDADPHAKFGRLTLDRACLEPGLDRSEHSSALATSSNEAMIPSPVCFTSRPCAATVRAG